MAANKDEVIQRYIAEQAITALLKEAEAQGIEMDTLEERTRAGLLGSKEYVWLASASDKGKAVELIEDTIKGME
ncbi:hypothetical protein C9933_01090 [Methylophaga nitratireducenticrescens]|uniref:Uncharacterized protein n=1 Tax=Pseudidiomarina aestuarii TaxID=624146 RepID=A0A2T4D3I4_9GAMM|nr:hypothetical protein C9933_01090 [Methylophaga nitratireducenticrescens]PTB88319.1 hypothetical protein C9927_04410 [Pseudidiomarina aestuarii]PTB88386.1 hypothetical protein C9928_06390 [Pseudidiomarina aestuarii]PTB98644.1 hypothetical protein C9993_06920 [Marinobacter sp. Z-F4-2]